MILAAAIVTLTWGSVTLSSNGEPLPTSPQYQVLRKPKGKPEHMKRVIDIRSTTSFQDATPGYWCYSVRAVVGGVVGQATEQKCAEIK